MTTDIAIKYFRTGKRLASLLGITHNNVYLWGKYPPELRQRQIEEISGGVLKVEPELKKEVLIEDWSK